MLTAIARAPNEVATSTPVKRALRFAAAIAREDTVDAFAALDGCTLLEIACAMRLLPSIRAATLQQSNAAYNAREAVPVAALGQRLRFGSEAEVARCVAAHGLPAVTTGLDVPSAPAAPGDVTGAVRFHAATFVAHPGKPLEPPPELPTVPAIKQWHDEKAAMAAAAASGEVTGTSDAATSGAKAEPLPASTDSPFPAVKVLGEAERQSRKAKRRLPPKGFLADVEGDEQLQGGDDSAHIDEDTPV